MPGAITPKITRPLISTDWAKAMLDLSEDQVFSLIEDGTIRWAFNLATPDASRRFLRIYRRSIDAVLNRALSQPDEIAAVIGHILPAECKQRGHITGTELQRYWNITSGHVLNLVNSGALEIEPKSPCQRGPGGSPRIPYASAFRFMEARWAI